MKYLLTLLMLLPFVACAEGDVPTYQNPVIKRSLPDPTVIKAHDGYFYLYATEDTHNVPIYRSKDLVTWRYAGTAFTDKTRPMDMVPNGGIWAPEINYIDGRYVLYYSKSEWGGSWEAGIGVAWSDRPNGNFRDAHKLFVSNEIGIENCIDPCFVQDDDGRNYLFFGSFHDIYGIELTADGLNVMEGAVPTKIAGGLIEATMIVKHDGYWYLIGSTGTCCEGANSTYRLVMTRSRNLLGPYVDRNGRSAIGDNFSPLLNKSPQVYGPGHCSQFVTDDAGQTWVLYHGFMADDVDAGRVTYLDRIRWGTGGWPQIQGMRPSTEAEVPLFGEAAAITPPASTANTPTQCYDLMGRRINTQSANLKSQVNSGLYILRDPDNSGNSHKVFIR
ncbi:MAG: family 43 glycosylhydrolase [Prevotella sp.]|nr:family 43 glycosylhydrolase [Prevotella sp.]